MQRLNDLIKGLVALTITVVLLIGVPVGLVVTIGWPLPTVWPGIDTVARHVTEGDIPDAFIIKVLATIIWIAWAQLTAATINEYVSILRGKAASRRPALPAVRLLAAKLATWTALIASAIAPIRPALAAPLESVSVAAAPPYSNVTSAAELTDPRPASAPAVADGQYRTRQGDTWWDISQRLLGDGIRWNEIRVLNLDARMPDGSVVTARTDILRAGWPLTVPVDADLPADSQQPTDDTVEGDTVVVEQGDHFWSIAEETLAAAWGRQATDTEISPYWVELVDTNKQRLLPPEDPNLIYPHQTFIVPDPPRSPDLATDLNGSKVLNPPIVTIEEPPTAGTSPPNPEPERQPETTKLPTPPTSTNPPAVPAGAEGPAQQSTQTPGEDGSRIGELIDDTKPIAGLAGGIALVGAALLYTLRRLRRIQAARRRPGATIDPPGEEAAAFEERVRAVATDGEDVRYLTAANAYLSHQLENASTPIPSIVAARAGKFGLELLLDEPCEPADGFIAVEGDKTAWRLRADIDARIMESEVTDAHPFAPALAVAGSTEGGSLLIDLEQLAAIAIEGVPSGVADFQRGLIASVCVAPWATHCEIVTIGIDGMHGEHQRRLTIPKDPRAWAAQTSEHMAGIARSLDRSPYEERVDHGTVYYPTIVFIGPDEPLAAISQHLAPIAQLAYSPLVVVTAHPLTSEYRILLHDEFATLEPFGITFNPVTLPAEDLAAIDQLIENASETAASPPTDTWANDVVESDSVRSNGHKTVETNQPPAPSPTEASQPRPLHADAVPPASGATIDAIAAILQPKPIEVRILGRQPAIHGLNGDAAPKIKAIIAYLAFHREVVGRRLRDEFWPGSDSRQACDNAMVKIRSLLGIGDDNKQRIDTLRDTSSYRVSEDVGLDWHRVEELIEASKGQPPADEAAYLDAACEMIDGHVAADAKPDLYGWLLREPTNYTLIETTLVDAAHRRGQLALAAGDVERANWAAQKGLEIVEGQEAMYRMKMKAASDAGDIDGVNTAYRHAQRAAESYGCDEEVQPETQDLHDKLTGGNAAPGADRRPREESPPTARSSREQGSETAPNTPG